MSVFEKIRRDMLEDSQSGGMYGRVALFKRYSAAWQQAEAGIDVPGITEAMGAMVVSPASSSSESSGSVSTASTSVVESLDVQMMSVEKVIVATSGEVYREREKFLTATNRPLERGISLNTFEKDVAAATVANTIVGLRQADDAILPSIKYDDVSMMDLPYSGLVSDWPVALVSHAIEPGEDVSTFDLLWRAGPLFVYSQYLTAYYGLAEAMEVGTEAIRREAKRAYDYALDLLDDYFARGDGTIKALQAKRPAKPVLILNWVVPWDHADLVDLNGPKFAWLAEYILDRVKKHLLSEGYRTFRTRTLSQYGVGT